MFLRLLAAAVALLPASGQLAPYVPRTDAEVLERLPLKPTDPVGRELRSLRQAVAADPSSLEASARLARRYFDLAMTQGDPRYIGYAEALLRPWAAGPSPPLNVLYLRALLKQYRHEFASALADLDAVLARDPDNFNAMSWRVAIDLVQADYRAARADCERARAVAAKLSAIACRAVVDGLTGRAAQAYAELSAGMARYPPADPDQKQWMLTRLAELALRLGEPGKAEAHFREAIAASGPDGYVLAAYADMLLDQKRPADVVALLREWTRSDPLLLRLALAETALGLPGAPARVRAVGERFAASALRGDTLHLNDEALFELRLRGNPARAVELAAQNWTLQREPGDARILMEAALAARRPDLAGPALQWLEDSGYEDRRFRALGEALRKLRR